MAKVLVDFGKCYEEQTKEVKEKFCRHDFYEIKNLLIFKKKFKKALTNKSVSYIIVVVLKFYTLNKNMGLSQKTTGEIR